MNKVIILTFKIIFFINLNILKKYIKKIYIKD